jgi:hypothetical protein
MRQLRCYAYPALAVFLRRSQNAPVVNGQSRGARQRFFCEDEMQALENLWYARGYLEVQQQVGGGGGQSRPAGVPLTPPGSRGGATRLGRRREGRDTRRPGRGPLFSRHRAIGCEDVLFVIDGVVLCFLPGSLRAKTRLGEPRVGRNLASELEDAGCRWSSRRSHPGCDERRGLRRSVGDDELQCERDPSEFQAGLHA